MGIKIYGYITTWNGKNLIIGGGANCVHRIQPTIRLKLNYNSNLEKQSSLTCEKGNEGSWMDKNNISSCA